jgi:hypothetical protein
MNAPARGGVIYAANGFTDLDKDGKWQYWYGEHPRGFMVYDATGHVQIQIMKVPALL